ncbi:non-homologous end-joining DNA ligase [Candidatus Parcubacteria bacterium]|nr:non-homologous end-joining DNA ligase [Candidatus Parcubacteria bacterium]
MRFLKPMLATLIDGPFDSSEYVYEIKWDGYRLISIVEKGKVTLYSRNGINVTEKYSPIAKALKGTKHDAIFDGELVALDSRGKSIFELMQHADSETKLQYCVFDLLCFKGKDLRSKTLIERKQLLKEALPRNKQIVYSEHIEKEGKKFFAVAKKKGLEGIIAKTKVGKYYSGKRTREWLKIKTGHEQEVVIVGFTAPQKSRKHFGSLVLAVHEGTLWRYVGRAGTGFDEALLKLLHDKMKKLITKQKPITEKVPDEKQTTWIKPNLVGEVKFTEWTSNGEMRHPAFKGLRTDKKATQVTRELPA